MQQVSFENKRSDWKSWNNRAKELAGFKGWLEKFACGCVLSTIAVRQSSRGIMSVTHPNSISHNRLNIEPSNTDVPVH